jgi:dihydrofolate synthase/folylpolyglutamate synthase
MGRISAAAAGIEPEHGQLTFFEILTTLALLHFAEQAVDIAVIETGLGGRLDCTNAVEPDVTAITTIQLEHTLILGKTLPEIAREKAGIFKPGVHAIVAPQSEPVLAVFRDVAAKVRAPLHILGRDIEFTQRFEMR